MSKYSSLGTTSGDPPTCFAQFARYEANTERARSSPRMKIYGVIFAAITSTVLDKEASGFHLPVFSLLAKNTPYAVEAIHVRTPHAGMRCTGIPLMEMTSEGCSCPQRKSRPSSNEKKIE